LAIETKLIQEAGSPAWDAYVLAHPQSTAYHLSGWRNVIQEAYRHKALYLAALRSGSSEICGVLPLYHLKSLVFGNRLVSIPFFDLGGVLADSPDAETALVSEAVKIGKSLHADLLELRHGWQAASSFPGSIRTHKVRMLLELPPSAELLMKGFKSKLRSQINKTARDGLAAEIGGSELLDEFYEVFLINMRDLGSPVHSKKLLECVSKYIPGARVVVVRKDGRPLAGSIMIGFKKVLANPWASSLRQYSHLNPNMMLYWSMLEYACAKGYGVFDFGRSTPGEGTFKFKEQWGAAPHGLFWQEIPLNGRPIDVQSDEKSGFKKAIACWQKLPVPVTRVLGPRIRKYISL